MHTLRNHRLQVAIVAASSIIPLVAARAQTGQPLPPIRTTARAVVAGDSIDRFGLLTTSTAESQVRDLSALDMASALRRTPGVSIVRFNPVGAFGGGNGGAVFVRGSGVSRPGSEIKSYIDGVPFYLSVWNHPLLDMLPVHVMERIDVHKGPQPQTFGNAFAAVNLVPRRVHEDGVHGEATLAGGSFGTIMQQAQLSVRNGSLDVSGAIGSMRSSGHRPFANGRLENRYVRASYTFHSSWSADVTALNVDNSAHDPGRENLPQTRTGRFDTQGLMLATALRHDHAWARGTLRFYRSSGDGDWFDQPAPDGNTLTAFALSGVQLREELTPWTGATIAAGIDVDQIAGAVQFDRNAPEPTSRFDSPDIRITQPHLALGQLIRVGDNWSFTPSVGARWYAHSELDADVAPHAGIVLRRLDNFAVRATFSRGVNYPGIDAVVLSSLIPALGESWRSLEAEQLDQVEFGVSASTQAMPSFVRRAALDVSLFEHRARDRYQFAFPPVSVPPSFFNLGDYKLRGAEASLQMEFGGGVSTFASMTALDPTLETLPFSPRRSFSAGAIWQAPRVRITADVQGQEEMLVAPLGRSPASAVPERVPAFTVWQLRVAVPITQARGEVFASMENALDRAYRYLPGYPMPGRWGMVGVRGGF